MKNLPYSLIVVKSSEIFQHKKVHHIESKNILSHSNPVAARKGQSLQVRLKAFATNQEALSHPRLERPSQLLLGTCTTKSTGSIGQGSCVGLVCWRRPLLENECPRTPSAFSSIAHSWGMGCHPRKLFSLELVPLRRTGLQKKCGNVSVWLLCSILVLCGWLLPFEVHAGISVPFCFPGTFSWAKPTDGFMNHQLLHTVFSNKKAFLPTCWFTPIQQNPPMSAQKNCLVKQ